MMDGILKRGNIPEHATLAFEGVHCRIYHWQQEMFDGSFATFEKIVRIPAAAIIATVEGKILIQEQEQPWKGPFVSLPGGRAESYEEDLLSLAKRELQEESGMVSDNWELIADLSERDFSLFEFHLYLAKDCYKVTEQHLDAGEKIKNKFVTLDEFKEIMIGTRWRNFIVANYLNKPGNFDKLITALAQ